MSQAEACDAFLQTDRPRPGPPHTHPSVTVLVDLGPSKAAGAAGVLWFGAGVGASPAAGAAPPPAFLSRCPSPSPAPRLRRPGPGARCLDGFLGGRPPTTPGPKSPSSLKKPCSPEAPPSWQGAAGPGDTLSPTASGRSASRASFALTEHLGRRVALAWPSCLWRPAGMSAAVIWGHLPGLWPAVFYCFSEHPGLLTWLQGQPRAGSQISQKAYAAWAARPAATPRMTSRGRPSPLRLSSPAALRPAWPGLPMGGERWFSEAPSQPQLGPAAH